jgi:Velvet factor
MQKNYQQTKLSSFQYKASIRQEPQRGRMCGLGEQVSRRMLDPPLILEISFEGRQPSDTEMRNLAVSLTCHVSLKSICNDDQSVVMLGKKSLLPTLLGTTSVPAAVLKDVLDSKSKLFFVFHDLGIRLQGEFILECKTVDMARY